MSGLEPCALPCYRPVSKPELLSIESPSVCTTSMTTGTESPETSVGSVKVSLRHPGSQDQGYWTR